MIFTIGNRVGPRGAPALALSVLLLVCSGGASLLSALLWVWLAANGRHCRYYRGGGCDYYLVPGKRLREGRVDADFGGRLSRVASLWRDSSAPIFLSGGVTDSSGVSEARAGRDVLLQQGVDGGQVVLEERARHSFENLLFVRDMLPGLRRGVIVSSRYHLPRLCLMARELGLEVVPAAVEPVAQRSATPLRWLMEAFYVHWYCVARLLRHSYTVSRAAE